MQEQQQSIQFPVHKRENSAESQRHLDAHRDHFNAKCAETYRRLMAGERLTVLAAANSGISSLPRRIKDLREQGVQISDEWIEGVKVYYLANADFDFNEYTFRARDEAA